MRWRGFFRPMGGLFLVPIFLAFDLNPVPYHAVMLLLLLAAAYLMYRFARVLAAENCRPQLWRSSPAITSA